MCAAPAQPSRVGIIDQLRACHQTTGSSYEGLAFGKGVCAVTIMHSGQAMERGLRECCKSIRVGHLLIQHDRESQRPQVYYAKFAPDIAQRTILLLDPVISKYCGNSL